MTRRHGFCEVDAEGTEGRHGEEGERARDQREVDEDEPETSDDEENELPEDAWNFLGGPQAYEHPCVAVDFPWCTIRLV